MKKEGGGANSLLRLMDPFMNIHRLLVITKSYVDCYKIVWTHIFFFGLSTQSENDRSIVGNQTSNDHKIIRSVEIS